MARQVMQFRYYGERSSKNQPAKINKSNLTSGSIFLDYIPIKQLIIQGPPGVTFYLNGNQDSSIVLGQSGIFKLDLENMFDIFYLSFASKSLQLLNQSNDQGLIIDIIYDN